MIKKDGANQPDTPSMIASFWGSNTTHYGWTAIPNSLLMLQSELKISPTDFCILINVLMHQWPTDGHSSSFPAIDTIARRVGVSRRTVQRGVLKLEELGLINKEATDRNNRTTKGKNIIDTSLLKIKLNEMAEIMINEDKRKKKSVKSIHSCPICGKSANDMESVNLLFGVRETIAGRIINSHCKSCRSERSNDSDLF